MEHLNAVVLLLNAGVTLRLRTRLSDLVRKVVQTRNHGPGRRSVAGNLLGTTRPALMSAVVMWAALIATLGASEPAPKPLTMNLSANVATVRNEVAVRARVEPDARSRELVIEWVADDLSGGSHSIALEGERAARSHRYMLKHLTPGQYVVTAILRRNDGTETRSASNLWVVGVGETIEPRGSGVRGTAGDLLRPATQP